jgi:hypothetical protein
MRMRNKRINKNAGLVSAASLGEFTAFVLFMAAFFQRGDILRVALFLIAALVLAIVGHRLHYRYIAVAKCIGCKKEVVLPRV